jgi:hypothetical protein
MEPPAYSPVSISTNVTTVTTSWENNHLEGEGGGEEELKALGLHRNNTAHVTYLDEDVLHDAVPALVQEHGGDPPRSQLAEREHVVHVGVLPDAEVNFGHHSQVLFHHFEEAAREPSKVLMPTHEGEHTHKNPRGVGPHLYTANAS